MRLIRGKTDWRAIMLAIFLLLAPMVIRAETPQESPQKSVPQPTLEAKLSLHLPQVCPGSSILLTLELTNTGEEEIRFNRHGLWSDLSYRNISKPDSIMSQTSCFAFDPNNREHQIVLKPGEKHYEVFNFILEDDYFGAPGTYAISTYVSYHSSGKSGGSIRSGEAQFEVQECKTQ